LHVKAGDTVQVVNTAAGLRKLGVKMDVVESDGLPVADICRYDLVHLFNLMCAADMYDTYCRARSQGLPVVVSPVYWNPRRLFQREGVSGGYSPEWWQQDSTVRRKLVEGADILLPNARLEMKEIERDFGITKRYLVVPNAASQIFGGGDPGLFRTRYGVRGDFVLSVGRISPRKNQARLIRACHDLGLRLVLIGAPGDYSYLRRCYREAGEDVVFLGELDWDSLADAYAAARVHCLPSWYDTPGLANLEAALAGCQLVAGRYGTEQEYFGDLVFYCSPGDVCDISAAVERAWVTPPDPRIKELVAREYTWQRAAESTLAAYKMLS